MKTVKQSKKNVTPSKPAELPASTNILDYSNFLSMYERESLAAEAKLATERKKKKGKRSSSQPFTL